MGTRAIGCHAHPGNFIRLILSTHNTTSAAELKPDTYGGATHKKVSGFNSAARICWKQGAIHRCILYSAVFKAIGTGEPSALQIYDILDTCITTLKPQWLGILMSGY